MFQVIMKTLIRALAIFLPIVSLSHLKDVIANNPSNTVNGFYAGVFILLVLFLVLIILRFYKKIPR